jgi:hypothetical protein
MKTIEYLRSLAELNLCENCFQKYKALIEPSIKGYLSQPLSDWRQAESQITQIVMKTKGVFKGDTWVLAFDEGEEEKVAEYVDVNAFKEIKNWKFKWKIDYLHKNGILQDSSYRLLDKAREARNKILHVEPDFVELSKEDYALFSKAKWITSQIWWSIWFDLKEETIADIKSNTEKVAEQWLKTLRTKS